MSKSRNIASYFSYFTGFLHDVTGDYRTSFYVAGGCMLFNSMLTLGDPVWKKLDLRRS